MNERTDWTNPRTERMYIALFFPKALKTVQIITTIYTDGPERWMDRRDEGMEMVRMDRGTDGWKDGDGQDGQRDGRMEGWRDGPNGRTDIGIAERWADRRTGRMDWMDRRTEMDRRMD